MQLETGLLRRYIVMFVPAVVIVQWCNTTSSTSNQLDDANVVLIFMIICGGCH